MTNEQKKAKILSAAASFGFHSDLYWTEANELKAAGLIELRHTYTPTGNTVYRWFLVAA